MKTLENYIVLFDDECPMCDMYTNVFVKTGMLDKGGRAPYQQVPFNVCHVIDWQRAVNEIALVNLKNGEVTYGISSLFKIIASVFPFFGPLFSFKPFLTAMGKVYSFVSYNRRVIIPPVKRGSSFIFQPSLKKRYRIAYLVFSWFVTSYILTAYAHLLIAAIPFGVSFREYMICGGQIIFQAIVISTIARLKIWDYLGNMMTISLAGSLLLLLPLMLNHWFTIAPVIFPIYFLAVASLMLSEHIRRSMILDLGWTMSITWTLYRLLILILILD